MAVGRRRLLLLAGVVTAVFALVALLATGLTKDHTISASPLVGRPAPDFHLQGLDGRAESAIRLSDLRGQVVVVNFWASWCAECRVEQPDLDETWARFRDSGVVVVNFWASWCAECRVEQPDLDETWARFRDSGVVVVGVDFQDTQGDAREYVKAAGSDYPIVTDTDSTTALAFGLRGVPETFIVDQGGQIVERVIGPVTADRLADRITTLLEDGNQ
jgi:cytochrome c biogenesis protein CcmG, thiol:disulfide interchange protein DsbE